MDFNEFDKHLNRMAVEIKNGLPQLYKQLGALGLRFVDDNFRNQGWEGKAWIPLEEPNKSGHILMGVVPKLKISFMTMTLADGSEIYTDVRYAKVHNEGFKGTVSVAAYKRAKYQKTGKGKAKKVGVGMVKAYTYQANIPQRQFAPTEQSPSAILDKQAKEAIETFLKTILKPL